MKLSKKLKAENIFDSLTFSEHLEDYIKEVESMEKAIQKLSLYFANDDGTVAVNASIKTTDFNRIIKNIVID